MRYCWLMLTLRTLDFVISVTVACWAVKIITVNRIMETMRLCYHGDRHRSLMMSSMYLVLFFLPRGLYSVSGIVSVPNEGSFFTSYFPLPIEELSLLHALTHTLLNTWEHWALKRGWWARGGFRVEHIYDPNWWGSWQQHTESLFQLPEKASGQ